MDDANNARDTNSLDTQAIAEQLAARGYIAVLWHIDDVKQERPALTDVQAMEVLRQAERDHDASVGINWDVLTACADELYAPPEPEGLEPDDTLAGRAWMRCPTRCTTCWERGAGAAMMSEPASPSQRSSSAASLASRSSFS